LLVLACRLQPKASNASSRGEERKRRAGAGVYHLAVGEERHIGDRAEARMRVPAATIAHLCPEQWRTQPKI